MSSFNWPSTGSGGISTYTNFASLPASASDGAAAITLDTDQLYVFHLASSTWLLCSGPTSVLSVGTIDTQTPSSNGAVINSNSLYMQSASATNAGLINTGAQTLAGVKTFTSSINANGGVDRSTAGTLSIGTSINSSTINIGNSGATVNIQGTTLYENVTQLQVTDPLITLNKGGGAGSAANSGIELEENAVITGYAETSADRNSWIFKAPNTAGIATVTPGAGGITLNQSSHNPVTIGTANGLSIDGSQALSLALATTSTTGALSSTDWNTFNNKQSALTLPLAISQGGTGQTTQLAAINALTAWNTNSVVIGTGSSTNVGVTNAVIIGYNAGANSTNVQNVFIGSAAGQKATSAFANVFIGDGAGSGNGSAGNVTGAANIAIGHNALYGLQGPNYNIGIGYNALSATASADGNIGIGFSAGGTNTTGTHNILIGTSSDVTATGLSNATAIGYNTTVGASNRMVLGNGVNVGIDSAFTTNPTARLHLPGGTTSASSAPLKIGSGVLMTSAEAGAIETDNSFLYFTNSTPTRNKLFDSSQTLAIANGGTGQTTQTAAFNALSPLTTKGDIIYFDGTNNVRLGAGTSGQFLQTQGTAAAPQWTTVSASNFGAGLWSARFSGQSGTNFWSVSGTTIADFTLSGALTFSSYYGPSGFTGTSAAASSRPGVTFTAPNTGTVEVIFSGDVTGNDAWALVLTDGSNNILAETDSRTVSSSAAFGLPVSMVAFLDVTAATSYTVKLRGATASNTLQLGGYTAIGNGVVATFTVRYVK